MQITGHGRGACGVRARERGTIGAMPAARRPAAPSGVPRPAGERATDERATGRNGERSGGERGAGDRAEQRRVVRQARPDAPQTPRPTSGSPRRPTAPTPRVSGAGAARPTGTPAPRASQPPASQPPAPRPSRSAAQPPAPRSPEPARTTTPRTSTPSVPRPVAPRVRSAPSAAPRGATSRPTSRPDAGGRGGSGGGRGGHGPAEQVQQRVPRLFTVRAMVMLIVLSIAFVLVFPTLRQYLDQKVQLDQLQAQVDAAEQQNDDLQAELDRWADPAYVEAQARERLAFVMPGERALRVSDPEVVPDTTTAEEPASGPAVAADPSRPWYAQIWDSVQIAGSAGTGTSADQDPAGTGDNGTAPTPDGSVAPTP